MGVGVRFINVCCNSLFQGNYITKFKPEVLTANSHYTKEEKQESGSGTINVGSQRMLKKKMVSRNSMVIIHLTTDSSSHLNNSLSSLHNFHDCLLHSNYITTRQNKTAHEQTVHLPTSNFETFLKVAVVVESLCQVDHNVHIFKQWCQTVWYGVSPWLVILQVKPTGLTKR